MKRILLFLALSAAGTLGGQEMNVTARKYTGWNSGNLIFNRQALIAGPRNTYGVNFCQQKPGGNGETSFYMVLTEPRRQGGFGQHQCRFLRMEVNGIDMQRIMPQERDFKIWKKGRTAGTDMTFRFDGANILLSAYMAEDSPMLFLHFRPAETQLEPLRKFRIHLAVQVGGINGILKAENTVARTAARELAGKSWKQAKNTLNPEDRWLILYDRKLDGSGKNKGFGPSFLLLPQDFSNLNRAELILPDDTLASVILDVKADFRELTLGIWQNRAAISNQDFFRLFGERKKDFTVIHTPEK